MILAIARIERRQRGARSVEARQRVRLDDALDGLSHRPRHIPGAIGVGRHGEAPEQHAMVSRRRGMEGAFGNEVLAGRTGAEISRRIDPLARFEIAESLAAKFRFGTNFRLAFLGLARSLAFLVFRIGQKTGPRSRGARLWQVENRLGHQGVLGIIGRGAGLAIDVGFAWTPRGSGARSAMVDVLRGRPVTLGLPLDFCMSPEKIFISAESATVSVSKRAAT